MTKHFKASPRAGGDPIYFGLEDICACLITWGKVTLGLWSDPVLTLSKLDQSEMKDWLKDYDLFYNHAGQWFPYKGGNK